MRPKVSVCMITYNHEKYIAQAIESVMMQKTNFEIELVIGEDCSTDKTREICLLYKEKYPDKVNLRLPEKNLGMQPNLIANLQACSGEYIAMLEGDDYWIDPLKLQKQIDFLEANKDYSICFHNAYVKEEHLCHKPMSIFRKYRKNTYAITDLFGEWLIPTASAVFRNDFKKFPNWFYEAVVGDTPLFILIASLGKIKLLPEIMCVYRRHTGGVTYSFKGYSFLERMIQLYLDIDSYLEYTYSREINTVLCKYYNILAQNAFKNKDYSRFKDYVDNCSRIRQSWLNDKQYLVMYIRYIMLYSISISNVSYNISYQYYLLYKRVKDLLFTK